VKVESFSLGPFAANCLVLSPERGSEVFLVDPGFDVEQVLTWLAHRGKSPGRCCSPTPTWTTPTAPQRW